MTKLAVFLCMAAMATVSAFTTSPVVERSELTTSSSLSMGLFDGFLGQGSGKDRLDEQWEAQQEILRNRRKPKSERDAYFRDVEERRVKASKDQNDMWAWQSRKYEKGDDPINEWRKRRESGKISDLEDQYGDPKKIGGIPLPSASFGVGGEFGVGGKFDNGGRFDLRLPYAEQGYVDEDSDVMGKLAGIFGGGNKKKKEQAAAAAAAAEEEAAKAEQKKGWFW